MPCTASVLWEKMKEKLRSVIDFSCISPASQIELHLESLPCSLGREWRVLKSVWGHFSKHLGTWVNAPQPKRKVQFHAANPQGSVWSVPVCSQQQRALCPQQQLPLERQSSFSPSCDKHEGKTVMFQLLKCSPLLPKNAAQNNLKTIL